MIANQRQVWNSGVFDPVPACQGLGVLGTIVIIGYIPQAHDGLDVIGAFMIYAPLGHFFPNAGVITDHILSVGE